jgi:hypothetical protein
MKGIRLTALIFLILSYLSLILMFVYDNELQEIEFPYIFVVWGIGIINVVLNIYYGIKLELKTWILILLIISGLTWAFPPLLFTFIGIPFLITYLVIGLYIHGQKLTELKAG